MILIRHNIGIRKKYGKKTTINQRYTGLLERAGKPPDKKSGRGFRGNAADGKEIYFHDTGGYRQLGTSCQLQKTRIVHERLDEYHLQNDAGRI